MKIKFKKRNPQLGLPGMINDVSDLEDYTGNNIIKSRELNDFDWLGPLAGCPGVATAASIGYIYVLPFDVKFVYNKNESDIPNKYYMKINGQNGWFDVKMPTYKQDADLNGNEPLLYKWSTGKKMIMDGEPDSMASMTNLTDKYEWFRIDTEAYIFTEKGVSAMFVEPFYRKNKNYTVVSGILNTDKDITGRTLKGSVDKNLMYHQLNAFIIWHRDNTNDTDELLIPSGTPLIQIIPYIRRK